MHSGCCSLRWSESVAYLAGCGGPVRCNLIKIGIRWKHLPMLSYFWKVNKIIMLLMKSLLWNGDNRPCALWPNRTEPQRRLRLPPPHDLNCSLAISEASVVIFQRVFSIRIIFHCLLVVAPDHEASVAPIPSRSTAGPRLLKLQQLLLL